jgi:hypothetical protein
MINPGPGTASVINYLVPGTLGLILIVGLANPPRAKSKEELQGEEIETRKKKNNHLFAKIAIKMVRLSSCGKNLKRQKGS